MKRTKEEGNISTTCSKNGKTSKRISGRDTFYKVEDIQTPFLSAYPWDGGFIILKLRWKFIEQFIRHPFLVSISRLPIIYYISDFSLFSLSISWLYNLNNLLYKCYSSLKYYRVKHFKKHGKKCYYRYLTIAIQYPSKWKSEYQHQSINRQYFEKQHLCGWKVVQEISSLWIGGGFETDDLLSNLAQFPFWLQVKKILSELKANGNAKHQKAKLNLSN